MLNTGPAVLSVVSTLGGDVTRLRACLDATLASEFDGRLTVSVVCNDPRVPVPELLGVQVLQPGLNLGSPGALNHARSRAQADFVLVVHDVVRPTSDCLRALLQALTEDAWLAVVSPVALDAAGLVSMHSRGGFVGDDGTMEAWVPAQDCRPDELTGGRPLSFVASSGCLVRGPVWDEVGGFDPEFYPLLWSDVDSCHQVRLRGHSVALVPRAVIAHDRGGSTPGLFAHFLLTANAERFRAKHVAGTVVPPLSTDADPELLGRVGTAASLMLIDFAGHASAAYREQRERRDRLDILLPEMVAAKAAHIAALTSELTAIRASRSWRVVRRLRALRLRLRGRVR